MVKPSTEKKIYLIFWAFIIIAALVAYFVGITGPDKIIAFLVILGILGIVRIVWQQIWESLQRNYHPIMVACLLVAIVFTFSVQIVNLSMPIVSSGLIEFNYDLSSQDFTENRVLKLSHDAGDFILERLPGEKNNRYKLIFPHRIKQVELMYVEYGRGIGVTWKEGKDFDVKDNYIESRHEFNESIGKGRYLIVYQYRETLFGFLKSPWKILKNKF